MYLKLTIYIFHHRPLVHLVVALLDEMSGNINKNIINITFSQISFFIT